MFFGADYKLIPIVSIYKNVLVY